MLAKDAGVVLLSGDPRQLHTPPNSDPEKSPALNFLDQPAPGKQSEAWNSWICDWLFDATGKSTWMSQEQVTKLCSQIGGFEVNYHGGNPLKEQNKQNIYTVSYLKL